MIDLLTKEEAKFEGKKSMKESQYNKILSHRPESTCHRTNYFQYNNILSHRHPILMFLYKCHADLLLYLLIIKASL